MAGQEQAFLSGQDFGTPSTREMPQEPVRASGNPYDMVAPGAAEETDTGDINVAAEDLITRAILWITDENKPPGGDFAPREAFLNRVNQRGSSAPEAVGGAVGMVFVTLVEAAGRQGVEYPPESLLMALFPVLEEAVELVRAANIFPDLPEPTDEGDDYFGESDAIDDEPMELDSYQQFITFAAIEAATTYGEYLLATGQLDQQEWEQMMNEMMEEEAIGGELDDWDPLAQMTPGDLNIMMDRGIQAEQATPGGPRGAVI